MPVGGVLEVTGLAIILNTFKQLEWQRNDTLELLVNQMCLHPTKWRGLEVSLACNALGFFYIYHKRFWDLAWKRLPALTNDMQPQGVLGL